MQTFKTKGIVLNTIKYGETSIISHIYTELFGIQHYIVKGIRSSGKRKTSQISYFQPASILDLEVYHNELKELQFLKEFSWNTMFRSIHFDVKRNAIALYCAELLNNLVSEPEADSDFFEELIDLFVYLDQEEKDSKIANMPIHFTIKILEHIGIKFNGVYENENLFVLDFVEGGFTDTIPHHSHFLAYEKAACITELSDNFHWNNVAINSSTRREILDHLQKFIEIHVSNFKKLKSYIILQTIFS
jgi:DNA repair protein RecO (recombination protein O)